MRYTTVAALQFITFVTPAIAIDQSEFSSSKNVIVAPTVGSLNILQRSFGTSNTPVPPADNLYATLCTVTISPQGGEVLVTGQAVLHNESYKYDAPDNQSKNNITARSAIRILDGSGHHLGITEAGGPTSDEVNSIHAEWLTVHPSVYYRPPPNVPITFEVAAVTSYHEYYHSGSLVANHMQMPCYISATEFSR